MATEDSKHGAVDRIIGKTVRGGQGCASVERLLKTSIAQVRNRRVTRMFKKVLVAVVAAGTMSVPLAGVAWADRPDDPGSQGRGKPDNPGSQGRGKRDFRGTPGATAVRPLSVANSTSVSDNLLGPWLGLIGNSLNGSLNNSLNNSLNGAQVVADVGVLSPPFTVLSVTNI